MSPMSDLARQDEYLPDVGEPLIPSGRQLSPGLPAVNRAADVLSRYPGHVMGGLATLPERVFGASEEMRAGGGYNPAPAVEAALMTMGGGVAGTGPGGVAVGSGPIRAYHGSPHDFDKFDLAKIGTGEGAQVYGHGLYFAEAEDVARGYRNRLAPGKPENVRPDEAAIAAIKPEWDKVVSELRPIRDARDKLYHSGEWQTHPDYRTMDTRVGELTNQLDALTSQAAADTIKRNPHLLKGRMYEVNINADPAHFLDWDKPLYHQPSKVMDIVYPGVNRSELDLSDLHNILRTEAATKDLAAAGIPGIKYLDQGSRTKGAGSSNYVVFNPGIIDIMKKYGIVPPAAGAIGSLAAQDRYDGS